LVRPAAALRLPAADERLAVSRATQQALTALGRPRAQVRVRVRRRGRGDVPGGSDGAGGRGVQQPRAAGAVLGAHGAAAARAGAAPCPAAVTAATHEGTSVPSSTRGRPCAMRTRACGNLQACSRLHEGAQPAARSQAGHRPGWPRRRRRWRSRSSRTGPGGATCRTTTPARRSGCAPGLTPLPVGEPCSPCVQAYLCYTNIAGVNIVLT